MSARFEIVRGDAGWHARLRAANGRIVWVTEVYTRRKAAVRAIELLTTPGLSVRLGHADIRDVDERTQS